MYRGVNMTINFKRNIICIDLKSFFASAECIERGLDPFKVPLIVADPNRGSGAITLAVTPFLKTLGVKSRGRVYEIPKHIMNNVIIAPPRMNLYIRKSNEVIDIYLDYVSMEDMHIYSIDEVFLDLTNYLKLYNKTDLEIAQEILNTIYRKTGITATCGIGPNMLLAKIAMDTEAKHNKNNISKWTYNEIETKLWKISPLSKMWGIGSKMEKKLNNLGIYSVYDLAHYDKYKLKDKFGIIGEELWNHANGIDLSIISDYKNIVKNKSISHSQILFKDYDKSNVNIIIKEMCETLLIRLRKNHQLTSTIYFEIGYSKTFSGGFSHHIKLDNPTDDVNLIYKTCLTIFNKYYDYLPIRKVTIGFSSLIPKYGVQLNLFENEEKINKKNKLNLVLDDLKNKHGKNIVLSATSLLSDSTIKMRNKKIGGHHQ